MFGGSIQGQYHFHSGDLQMAANQLAEDPKFFDIKGCSYDGFASRLNVALTFTEPKRNNALQKLIQGIPSVEKSAQLQCFQSVASALAATPSTPNDNLAALLNLAKIVTELPSKVIETNGEGLMLLPRSEAFTLLRQKLIEHQGPVLNQWQHDGLSALTAIWKELCTKSAECLHWSFLKENFMELLNGIAALPAENKIDIYPKLIKQLEDLDNTINDQTASSELTECAEAMMIELKKLEQSQAVVALKNQVAMTCPVFSDQANLG